MGATQGESSAINVYGCCTDHAFRVSKSRLVLHRYLTSIRRDKDIVGKNDFRGLLLPLGLDVGISLKVNTRNSEGKRSSASAWKLPTSAVLEKLLRDKKFWHPEQDEPREKIVWDN